MNLSCDEMSYEDKNAVILCRHSIARGLADDYEVMFVMLELENLKQ